MGFLAIRQKGVSWAVSLIKPRVILLNGLKKTKNFTFLSTVNVAVSYHLRGEIFVPNHGKMKQIF